MMSYRRSDEPDFVPLDEGNLHMIALETRTQTGWEGAAAVACPSCGAPIPLRVMSVGKGRMIGLWLDRSLHAEHTEVVRPTPPGVTK